MGSGGSRAAARYEDSAGSGRSSAGSSNVRVLRHAGLAAARPPALASFQDSFLTREHLAHHNASQPSQPSHPSQTSYSSGTWRSLVDPASGQQYYWNAATGETSWERPSLSSVTVTATRSEPFRDVCMTTEKRLAHPSPSQPLQMSHSSASGTWRRLVDPASGQRYYWNSATGETSWERPSQSTALAARPCSSTLSGASPDISHLQARGSKHSADRTNQAIAVKATSFDESDSLGRRKDLHARTAHVKQNRALPGQPPGLPPLSEPPQPAGAGPSQCSPEEYMKLRPSPVAKMAAEYWQKESMSSGRRDAGSHKLGLPQQS
eukprot:TRINITY_DN55641_c0_g1_i1.p1 TRINITY_DN55641_c0_g1~~TRINITY_DN55641_c0_g1_i1.p1  ORF type:complete len:321 (-),score=35.57 TRINITY_DN55641_c0_g1_i1:51-1013(-)